MKLFDLAQTPLEPGTTLIEASAGTGKTFTIAGLILRLIVEERLAIRQILAVTFTKAATEELRERVRSRLRDALSALRNPGAPGGDAIIAQFLASGGQAERAACDLDLALQSFDEAQIFTIHGFCQRVLRENAFESGVLFDLELLTQPAPLFEEVARDFWRNRFYSAPALITRLAILHEDPRATWIALLERTRNHPHLRLLPGADELPCDALAERLLASFDALRDAWKSQRDAIGALFGTCRDFKIAFNEECLANASAQLDLLVSSPISELPAQSLQGIASFSTRNLRECLRAGKTAPGHPFFHQCEEFRQLSTRFFSQLNHEFLAAAAPALLRKKTSRNLHTYDDLLTQLQRALSQQGESSPLASSLRAQYRAALIDEFQDTDPLQYGIFKQLFGDTGAHHFYQIGDPKQAIYAFRGADVFTYLAAAKAAQRRFTLGTNFRSEAGLLHAINTLFGHVPEPFAHEDIRYHPLSCGAGAQPLHNATEAPAAAPMRFRCLGGEQAKYQGEAEKLISDAVVDDIATLLASGARMGDRAVSSKDIAVLTRTNPQAAQLQSLLRARGIQSVLHSDSNVFKTSESGDLLRWMKAVLEPGRDVLLKTALATPLVGSDGLHIHALQSDQQRHQEWLELFLALRERWETEGFIAMFREALVKLDVRRRLVGQPGGERLLTNFLHLSELLHEAETARRLAPEAVCEWLRSAMKDAAAPADESQLRLESDEDAVTLVTIHKSKGLEYPIVFCPFLWKPAGGKSGSALLFHDEVTGELTYDLRGGDQEHERRAREEQKQEMLRLLYVAVTRAKSACFIYAAETKTFGESPLAHVMGGTGQQVFAGLAEKSEGTISVSDIEPGAGHGTRISVKGSSATNELAARSFTASIPKQRMIASFSSLVSGRLEEAPDRDEVAVDEPVEAQQSAASPLNTFDRGVRAGLFLHEVLEHANFQKPKELAELVGKKLAVHGLKQEWREPLAQQLQLLFKTELTPGLSLSKVIPGHRLNEVEFSYPVTSLLPRDLEEVFARHASAARFPKFSESLCRLRFDPVAGTMRGFIDLLFQHGGRYYLVDWKSNWLGAQLSDYEAGKLEECMLQHSYHLQYHLYCVAADLFLRHRDPAYRYQTHFGGVFYVFLRGLDRQHPHRGVFQARPESSLIDDLRTLFTGALA